MAGLMFKRLAALAATLLMLTFPNWAHARAQQSPSADAAAGWVHSSVTWLGQTGASRPPARSGGAVGDPATAGNHREPDVGVVRSAHDRGGH